MPSPQRAAAVLALTRAAGESIRRRVRSGLAHPPSRSLRVHIVGAVLLAMIPLIVGVVVIGMGATGKTRRLAEERLAETAQDVASAMDQQLDTLILAMETLAASPGLEPGADVLGFYGRARRLADSFRTRMAARGRDGRQIFNTSLPFGEVDDTPLEAGLLARAFVTGQPVVSDISPTPKRLLPRAILLVPVVRGDVVVATLEMEVRPTRLTSLLQQWTHRPDGLTMLFDAAGHVASVSRDAGITVGQMSPILLPPSAGDRRPVLAAGWLGGGRNRFAIAAIARAPGWHVVYGEPPSAGSFDLSERPSLWLAGIAAAIVLGLSFAALLGGRLARMLLVFTTHVGTAAIGPDRPEAKLPVSAITEFEALRLGMVRSDAVLRRRGAAERMALREARTGHELLVSVVNATAECIYVKDLDLRYVLVNRAALNSGPEPREEWQVLGRSTAELFPPAVARRIEMGDRTVLATGRMTSFEQDYVPEPTPDSDPERDDKTSGAGETRWLWMTITPWQDAAGRVVGVVSVSRDITEQRAASARLRGVQADLLRATRLSAMGAMASGLAHELNQPLAAATNYLNAGGRLLDRGVAGDTRALHAARGAVADAAQQMLRAGAIMRSLRHFVGRGEAELLPEDVGELIREACALALDDGITGGIDLLVGAVPAAAIVLVDRTQIQQVLLNLIRNAAEAITTAHAGSPPCPAGRPAGQIVLSALYRPPEGMCIEVTDNGPGLAPEVAERLFQPFVSTKPTGMGIGLAICHTIVQGHGGVLTAEQVETGGMRFRIALPALLQPGGLP